MLKIEIQSDDEEEQLSSQSYSKMEYFPKNKDKNHFFYNYQNSVFLKNFLGEYESSLEEFLDIFNSNNPERDEINSTIFSTSGTHRLFNISTNLVEALEFFGRVDPSI